MATRRQRHNVSTGGTPSSPPPAVAVPPAGGPEDIVEFEDAEVHDADALPLRTADMPAPLTVREDALDDERLRAPVAVAAPAPEEARQPEPAAAADPAPVEPDPTDQAASDIDDFMRDDEEAGEADITELPDEPSDGDAEPEDALIFDESEELDEPESFEAEPLLLDDAPGLDDSDGRPSLADDEDFWAGLEAGGLDEEELVPPPSLIDPLPPTDDTDADETLPATSEQEAAAEELGEEVAAAAEPAPLPIGAEDPHSDEEWAPSVHVAARQAVFGGPNALSLISSNLKDEEDELNHALSAFADLNEGESGFIRLSMRSYPEFKDESRAWLAARKLGQDPAGDSKKPHQQFVAWLKYGLSMLWFEANKSNPSRLGGGAPPLKPGQTGNTKPLTPGQAGAEEAEAWKNAERKVLAGPHYECDLRVGVITSPEDRDHGEQVAEEVAHGFAIYSTTHQELLWNQADPLDAVLGCMGTKRDNVMLALSADEMGELARVPDDLCRPQGVLVKRSTFKQIPLATPLVIDDMYNPPQGIMPMGIINPRSEDAKVFGMRVEETNQHFVYAGRTGTGKSELMKWLVFGVAKAGYPLVVIDPHGALSEDVLNTLVINCPERLKDIMMCDLSDPDWPVALNPLDVRNYDSIEPTVHSIMEMLAQQLDLGASAPRARMFAQQAITALCEANLRIKDPDTKLTLLHVVTFFADQELRRMVMEFCTNPSVKEQFDPDTGPFESMSEKQQTEITMPVIRAFSALGNSDSFSAVFSAGENRLDFGRLISDNRIIIVKLARFSHQKKLGEFVGALILPWLLSSMDDWGRKRDEETGEVTGTGCRVFVDEAPTLIGPDSAAIEVMAEARKWDLGLIFTGQYLEQFDPVVIKAAMANTASKLALALGPTSAKLLGSEIAGNDKRIGPTDISDLPRFHFYANLLLPGADGSSSNSGPFSAACLPPINCDLSAEHKAMREEVKERSRQVMCNSKEDINKRRLTLMDNIKGALGQLLMEQVDSKEGAGGGDYSIPLDSFDDNRTFGGW